MNEAQDSLFLCPNAYVLPLPVEKILCMDDLTNVWIDPHATCTIFSDIFNKNELVGESGPILRVELNWLNSYSSYYYDDDPPVLLLLKLLKSTDFDGFNSLYEALKILLLAPPTPDPP